MGKKPQKTKELSVAIAEASTTIDESHEPQIQPQAPRKRGRPRKIIVKMESEEEKTQAIEEEQPEASIEAQGTESTMEKVKGNEESSSSACIRITKQEEMQPRSRARRKSKPRKSS